MRVVIQRVSKASVTVEDRIVGRIDRGILIYVGLEKDDTATEATVLAEKIMNLRIFPDSEDKMNLCLLEIPGAKILSISQFTLTSYVRKGRRPDFSNAMEPRRAEVLYAEFNRLLSRYVPVEEGVFGAMMKVDSINDGPVTFIVERKHGQEPQNS